MISEQKSTQVQRQRRKSRVRKKFHSHRHMRMSVFRSNTQLYVQIIDDNVGQTIVAKSTLSKEFASLKERKARSSELGKQIGALAKAKGITHVVFDRGMYKFHGHVALMANGAREAGLQF
ncbi:MAG: 50S ribosomal protein L18 [Chlamydiae bacterium RIFCSPHIGHO2_12_FULL_49_11]|nr:MAG: 50S ribosomal protein L18 [Chlamydiae bacterium RIFCSPHIGHO2_12_FULL_49_11]